ncbi:aldose 1-epimerase family protein [Rhodococcus sp. 27YEA15]|uniref:aldose 1-epimerase family protein n=1 Tax=Rhodococcus sp. 27YEA15 TaxID=3156259 RepID=UPI003C7A9555
MTSPHSTGRGGFEIRAGGYRAEIAAAGAGLRLLDYHGSTGRRALTETWDLGSKPPLSAGLVLAPWPNRIRDGRFFFDGIEHQLEITEPAFGNASHGFVRRRNWDLVEHTYERVELSVDVGLHKGWPYPLQLTTRYAVDDAGLTVTHTATNNGGIPAPFGLGMHTFVRAGDFPLDECALHLAAGTRLDIDPERMLPSGSSRTVEGTEFDFRTPRLLAGVQLDTPYSALAVDVDGTGRTQHELLAPDGTGTALWTSREFAWIQAFVADPANGKGYPDRGRALALEPMTCPPDAFNSGIDVLVLDPGRTWSASWGIRAL